MSMVCRADLATCVLISPIGFLECELCDKGLHSSTLKIQNEDELQFKSKREVEVLIAPHGQKFNSVMESVYIWAQCYFYSPQLLLRRGPPMICEESIKSNFRRKVCLTLANTVLFGETITYGNLAARIGKSKAAQAVGQVMATNPLQIIVPCHRVIPNTGQVGQYCRGKLNWLKEYLLKYETRK